MGERCNGGWRGGGVGRLGVGVNCIYGASSYISDWFNDKGNSTIVNSSSIYINYIELCYSNSEICSKNVHPKNSFISGWYGEIYQIQDENTLKEVEISSYSVRIFT